MSRTLLRRMLGAVMTLAALALLALSWPAIHAAFTALFIDAATFVRGCF